MRRTPRSLIANEGYEVAWTRGNEFFNQPLPPVVGSDGSVFVPPPINRNPSNEYPWVCRGYPVVIPINVDPNKPLLLEDNYRSLLIFQNNSSAISPDIAPNLFISLDGPVQFVELSQGAGFASFAYNALTLIPNEGLLLDTRTLGNALYFAWGNSTNTNNTVVTFGMCIYGRTLNSPPLPPAPAAPPASRQRFTAGFN